MRRLLLTAGLVALLNGERWAGATSAPATDSTVPTPNSGPDTASALAGWAWEGAGIRRSCGDVWWQQQQMSQRRCTELAIGPDGIPVSYDPLSRRITRERREDAGTVTFVLPTQYVDASLLAAGPDDVVYLALDNPVPTASDVLAVSLSPDDVGRVIRRFPTALATADADVLTGPTGLLVSGWHDLGPRPEPAHAPAVPWVDRAGSTPSPMAAGSFDDAQSVVRAGNGQWTLIHRRVVAEQPGSSAVLPTFDGGFIAAYSETTGRMRTELFRGWRDGSVVSVELPLRWPDLDGSLVLEPQGTVLVPNGDSFARLAPFDTHPNGWDGRLRIDLASGTATAVGLDDFLDRITWPSSGQADVWPWGTSPVAVANAVAGTPSSPAELRTIEQGPPEGTSTVVTVTTEGLLDDSVYGRRLVVHLAVDQPGFRVQRIEWSNACQPGRGHQDYRPALCN